MVLKSRKYTILFLAPTIILMCLFLYYPLIRNFYYTFTNFDGYNEAGAKFVEFKNYIRLINDPIIGKSVVNTLVLMGMALVFEAGIALILAIMVSSIKKGFKFFRTVYFIPVVISGTAIGLMFSLMYGYDYGLLNGILTSMGMEKKVWLTEQSALLLTIIPTLWQYIGFYFVIILTGLSKIPDDIYESATLEGVTGMQKAIYITIPLIKDVILTVSVLIITGVLKTYDTVWVIARGGPMNASELLSTYMYSKTFTDQNFAYGSTIAVLMIILGLFLSVASKTLLKSESLTY